MTTHFLLWYSETYCDRTKSHNHNVHVPFKTVLASVGVQKRIKNLDRGSETTCFARVVMIYRSTMYHDYTEYRRLCTAWPLRRSPVCTSMCAAAVGDNPSNAADPAIQLPPLPPCDAVISCLSHPHFKVVFVPRPALRAILEGRCQHHHYQVDF